MISLLLEIIPFFIPTTAKFLYLFVPILNLIVAKLEVFT